MEHIRAYVLVCSVAFCTVPAASQKTALGEVDRYVKAEMRREHIPGLALGVYREGRILKAQAYGLANIELNAPVRAQSIFQSGSISKQFAATAVMMLVEEGKVSLEDSITKFFPEARASWQSIKVRNLLSHTSGLTEYDSEDKTEPGGPNWRNYGFGWVMDAVNGHKVIEHSGYSEGFTAHIARYLDDRLTVVVLTNLGTVYAAPDRIARHVAGLYEPVLMPPKRKAIEDKDPRVTAFIRSALEKMARGKPDPGDFAAASRDLWSSDIEDWTAYVKGLGELKSFELLERKQQGGERRYIYRVRFREGTLVLALVLDADNKISGLDETPEE